MTARIVRDAFVLRPMRFGDFEQLAGAVGAAALFAWAVTGNVGGVVAIAAITMTACLGVRFALPRLTMAGAITMALAPLLLLASTCWTLALLNALAYPLWLRMLTLAGVTVALAAAGFTFAGMLARQALFTHRVWQRPIRPQTRLSMLRPPKVSIQLPCYSEPPEIVIATMDHLAELDYLDFEVLVCDNNTEDEALWRPLEQHCARLNRRFGREIFRFFHVAPIEGAKAGALNFCLDVMAPDAELVAVIDADYLSRPDFLSRLVGFFEDEQVGYVQTPHDYRDFEDSTYLSMCYWEYMPTNKIDYSGVSEYDAAFTIGTMCVIRTEALRDSGGWAEWCLTEDSEVSVRLRALGYQGVYVRDTFGRGLIPETFEDYKKQRFRWTAGPVQQLCRHWRLFMPGRFGASPDMGGWSKLLEIQRCMAPLVSLTQMGFALVVMLALGIATAVGSVPKFDLPMVAWLSIGLGVSAGLVRKWHRYRLSGCRRISHMVGAEIAKMSLSYIVLVAGIAGLSKRPLAWRRTPKFQAQSAGLAALGSTLPEVALGFVFVAVAGVVIAAQDVLGGDFVILGLAGSLGYALRFFAAPVMALMSERHLDRNVAVVVDEDEEPAQRELPLAA